MTAYSTFQRRLEAGQIVVTGEVAPPKGATRATLEALAGAMRDYVDAVNLTDNQRGLGRMSALGAGIILRQIGIEPIVQMTCQHRNRIALQADLLSGVACGIANFLCMTGDHPKIGDHPDAKNVLDLNSFQLIRMLRAMRDEGRFQSGTPLVEARASSSAASPTRTSSGSPGSRGRSRAAPSSSRPRSSSTSSASGSGWPTRARPGCTSRPTSSAGSW